MTPDFLGLGAMKAGTTALHRWLDAHPDVGMPTTRKEIMFFDRHWDRGTDWYAHHWEGAVGRVRGEITPGYLFDPDAPARAAQVCPDAQLIAILRDPIQRALSQWRFYVKTRAYPRDAAAFLKEHPNAVGRGLYGAQLSRWRAHFPAERFLVLVFEEAMAKPEAAAAQVYRHLGVDDAFVPPDAGKRTNASALPRQAALYRAVRRSVKWLYARDLDPVVKVGKRLGLKRLFVAKQRGASLPPVPEHTLEMLRALYRPDVAQASDLVGRDLTEVWAWAS